MMNAVCECGSKDVVYAHPGVPLAVGRYDVPVSPICRECFNALLEDWVSQRLRRIPRASR